MMVTKPTTRSRRRGIVLVVVLALLALLALIGITFATFSGQARVNARNFAASLERAKPDDLFDFALSQLIGDTNDPRSVIRGHSMARDMYGSDAGRNGYLPMAPDGTPLHVTGTSTDGAGRLLFRTNIPTQAPYFYGFNFTRWVLRLKYTGPYNGAQPVDQTFEVLFDDNSGSTGFSSWARGTTGANYRVFTVSNPTLSRQIVTGNPPTSVFTDLANPVLNNYTMGAQAPLSTPPANTNDLQASGYPSKPSDFQFVLDGRYLRAFNGQGVGGLGGDYHNHSMAQYANHRYNGNILADAYYKNWDGSKVGFPAPTFNPVPGDPNDGRVPGMDEDYDACDLENWFLAMQSGDGEVVIPSFHRPGILTAMDWSLQFDINDPPLVNAGVPAQTQLNETRAMSRILRPRTADGHDAATFPDLVPNPLTGKIAYDVDNDQDGVKDSVWLDLGYPARLNEKGILYKPLFAFLVVGLNGRIPLNTAGNLATGVDDPRHANHLGNSPSEVDPTYALQNAFAAGFSQVDNGGIDVRLTQLRNLLTGTRPLDTPYNPTFPYTPSPAISPSNGDANWVQMGLDSLGNPIPFYMPNGLADAADMDITGTNPPAINSAVANTNPPVAGRWGEKDFVLPNGIAVTSLPTGFQNLVRAGLSISAGVNAGNFNVEDDNHNTIDLFPFGHVGEVNPGPGMPEDLYDASGALATPIERMRRFVTPIDLSGAGLVTRWNTLGGGANRGADAYGRVAFSRYYRPPGVPGVLNPDGSITPRANNALPFDLTNNLYHGYESFKVPNLSFYNNGGRRHPEAYGGMAVNGTNLGTLAGSASPGYQLFATAVPTYDNTLLFNYMSNLGNIRNMPGFNEADEMNLYEASRSDSPFTATDLEWLYRRQDSDGASLSSRLSRLAPVSLDNPLATVDSMRRRRLFSLDSYELNRFAWAPDNPASITTTAPASTTYPYTTNARFSAPTFDPNIPLNYSAASASFANVNLTAAAIGTAPAYVQYPWGQFSGALLGSVMVPANPGNAAIANPLPPWPVQTPALAHGDRKININYPLPISNDPDEMVRKKWIYDAYQLAKAVLPPQAVDTPQELAQLSQFLVNVIDFRDHDGTCTHFVNPDVVQNPVTGAAGTYAPSTLVLSPGLGNLNQYGMEYSPVALNEVLSFSYPACAATDGDPINIRQVNRLFVELVNVLTDATSNVATNNASQLDLNGWQMVILPDDPRGRPDPVTGQLPTLATGVTLTLADNGNSSGTPVATTPLQPVPITQQAASAGRLQVPLDALQSVETTQNTTPHTNFYYVIANNPPTFNTKAEQNALNSNGSLTSSPMPRPSSVTDNLPEPGSTPPTPFTQVLLDQLPRVTPIAPATAPAANPPRFFWLYLLRPANPFLPIQQDRTQPNYNPAVVADSIRFPFMESGAYVSGPDAMDSRKYTIVNTASNAMYSVGRLQPFRGGQSIPANYALAPGYTTTSTGTQPYAPTDAYGYSEQPLRTDVQLGVPYYGANTNNASNYISTDQTLIRQLIYHTIGRANTLNGAPAETPWTYFPFNDRDFTSVAELLLVPGCPPGLFTKKFVEFPPPLPVAATGAFGGWPQTAVLTAPVVVPPLPTPLVMNAVPQTHPYLVDDFFYSGAPLTPTQPTVLWASGPTVPNVGGPNGAGWHKLLEFFEVPSPMQGAIGTVAQGLNFDWARQDFKPGLLNLNLMIDEEVFFSLLGEQDNVFYLQQWLNFLELPAGSPLVPQVVTQVDLNGSVTASYPMSNKGVSYEDLVANNGTFDNRMKAAFAQFLRVRHGGSPYLFGHGVGEVGRSGLAGDPIPADRPFRSLSFPDIDFTILRPAALPPSAFSHGYDATSGTVVAAPMSTSSTQPLWRTLPNPPALPNPAFVWDPGTKNPYQTDYLADVTGTVQPQPPPIPTRRLFQIPDSYNGTGGAGITPRPSNAALVPSAGGTFVSGDAMITTQVIDGLLFPGPLVPGNPLGPTITNGVINLLFYGAPPAHVPPIPDVRFASPTYGGAGDRRQNPYFRSEMLQRVMNLTTVRTHQYAVWITVGFFKVIRRGDPLLASTNPSLAYDILGEELGKTSGTNVQNRGFFVVDRLRLFGFDPNAPGGFRDAVLYRQTIR